jgi:hypothetical protein
LTELEASMAVPEACRTAERETMDVSTMSAEELARAAAAPGVRRFVSSGVADLAIAGTSRHLSALAGRGLSRPLVVGRLLEEWMLEAAGPLRGADVAVAVCAVAGEEVGAGCALSTADERRLGDALLSHAIGVFFRRGELERLVANPDAELAAYRTRAGDLLARLAEGESAADLLWLELEETAAAAAAAAGVVVVESAFT